MFFVYYSKFIYFIEKSFGSSSVFFLQVKLKLSYELVISLYGFIYHMVLKILLSILYDITF